MTRFEERLRDIINQSSRDNASNTPDFILAEFLSRSLDSFTTAVTNREVWHGRGPLPTHTKPAMETTAGSAEAQTPGERLRSMMRARDSEEKERQKMKPLTHQVCRDTVSMGHGTPPSPSHKNELQKALDLAEARGRTIFDLTSRWAARRQYQREQSEKVAQINHGLLQELTEIKAWRDVVAPMLMSQQADNKGLKDRLRKAEARATDAEEAIGHHEREVSDLRATLAAVMDERATGKPMPRALEVADQQITYLQTIGTRQAEEIRALKKEIGEAQPDVLRFRWLCEDHPEGPLRAIRNLMLYRLQGMSYRAACPEIDAAMANDPVSQQDH